MNVDNYIKPNIMNIGKNVILLVAALATLLTSPSCDKFLDCGDCFTPPDPLFFSILDKNDSTDVYYSGKFDPDSALIYYLYDKIRVPVDFEIVIDSTRQSGILQSNAITWKSVEGYKVFYLELDQANTDTLFLNVEAESENCCTYHPIMDFTVNGEEPELDAGFGFFYYR